ncbi:glycosyltransferase family 2 protein [Chloroflexota bacterium]
MKQPSKSGKQKNRRIIAGLPAYNEESYIGSIVLKTIQYVDEVIVIDDGSTDKTAEIARLAGATVIQHKKNMGYGAGIQTLFTEAKKRNPDVLVLLDADSQHEPDEIPELIQPIYQGFDIVIGSREENKEDIPRYRRAGQRVIAYFSHMLSGENVSDSESGFRVFSNKAISTLDMKETGMAISAETIYRAAENGLRITERPISIRYPADGSTLNPVTHGFGVLSRIIVMISERRPLLFFGISGVIAILLGVIAGFVALGIIVGGGGAVSGWTLVAILLFVVGTFSIFTGLMLNVLMNRRG